MTIAIEEKLIETIQGIDTGMAYLITGIQKLVDQSDLSLKYNMVGANRGTPHKIGGYVHGRTSNGDPFVLLYPAKKTLKHKITRVYEQSFDDLPWFIETKLIANNAQDGNPDKDKAKKLGIYHDCDWFEIATIPGKDTQMGPEQRYYMTIKIYSQKSQTPPPSNEPAGQPAEIYEPPTVEHDQAMTKLNTIIGEGISELTEPYTYQDGTELADNPKLQKIFVTYWEQVKEIATDGAALKLWYANNRELVNA